MLLNIPHVDGLINKSFERGDPLLSSSNPPPVVNFGYTLSSLVFTSSAVPLREKDHLPSSESSTLQGNFLRTWRDRRSLHHSPLGGVSLMLLHCRQWPSLSFAWRESSCFVRIFLTAVMCLNEIFNFLQQRDAPRKEIVDFSSHDSHFRSGINFLYAGTIASIHKDEWWYFFLSFAIT